MTDNINVSNTQLQEQVDRLTVIVESLHSELTELRAQATNGSPLLADGAPAAEPTEPASSRRHLLKLAGGAAAAAVAGSVLLDGARPAAANSGENMVTGHRNFAQNMTRILNAPGVGTVLDPSLTTEKTLFWADNRNSVLNTAVGVRGDGRDGGTGIDGYGGTGVSGTGISSTGSSTGVAGSGNTGVRGFGTVIGVAGVGLAAGSVGLGAVGARAAVLLTSGTGSQPPNRTDAHVAGEIDLDGNGTAWLCVTDGTPGIWRKIGGATTAGALHAISPVRAFDSRWTGNTRLSNGLNKVVSVADAHNLAGGVTTPDIVPAGATAIAYNVTVTRTTGQGFLSVNPGDATAVTSSSINWFGESQDIANGLIVALDGSRQIKVFGGGGGSTDFVIDVTGYFR